MRGSLTVEAALVFPIFLFAIMSLLSFVSILQLEMKVNGSLSSVAKETAVYAAVGEDALGELGESGILGGTLLSETYVRAMVMKDLGSEYIAKSPAESAMNFSFLGSTFMEDDRIELHCNYKVEPFFSLSPLSGFFVGDVALARAYTGYDNAGQALANEKEEIVYITPYGTAYHKDKSCNYLDLSIQRSLGEQVGALHNKDGGRYHACPICARGKKDAVVYITDYGDCYHNDAFCSGLKRTVEAVPISKVGGRTPCMKCYG
ncbi:MAG: pilus assembly protein [Lachnospiraceae bacterium]|nr:pilus assembly protein [Lachnospiraceae bacterium]